MADHNQQKDRNKKTRQILSLFAVSFLCVCAVFLCSPSSAMAQTSDGLFINEFMTGNTKVFDEDGDSSDWIEIYNSSSHTIDLSGYGLSDHPDEIYKWTFAPGTTISAGGYLVVFASDKDRRNPYGELHTNFKLSNNDDTVVLTNRNDVSKDEVMFPPVPRNLSYGRTSSGPYELFVDLTPGVANSAAPLAPVPQFEIPGGFYSSSVNVSFDNYPGGQIHYTTDGRKPDKNSPVYNSPITLTQTKTLRAIGIKSGYKNSAPVGQTYFIDFDRREYQPGKAVPVLVISTEEENLWDPSVGIFPGSGDTPDLPPNMQRGERRPVHIDYFDEQGHSVFSVDGQIQVVGNSSRREWMRPFKLSCNEEVDPMHSHFEYSVLKGGIKKYRHLQVRNNNQDGVRMTDFTPDFRPTMGIRNSLFTDLSRDQQYMDVREDSGPILLIINRVNYGLGSIGEKRDNSTIEVKNSDIDDDDVDMIVLRDDEFEADLRRPEGSVVSWDYYGEAVAEYEEVSNSAQQSGGTQGITDLFDVIEYIRTHSMSNPTHYAYVQKRLHTESFITSMVFQIIAGNVDYINNNIGFWRSAPVGEEPGPFYTTNYDFDATFGISRYVQRVNSMDSFYDNSKLIQPLCNNPEFRNAFIRKFDELLNTVFVPSYAQAKALETKEKIEPWIDFHLDRWAAGLIRVEDWQQHVSALMSFLGIRPADVRYMVKRQFNLPDHSPLTFSVSPDAGGDNVAGTIYLENLSEKLIASGTYFSGLPLTLVAKNEPGYRFIEFRMNGASVSTESRFTFIPNGPAAIEAVFEQDDTAPVAEVVINEVVNSGNQQLQNYDWIELYNTTDRVIDLTGMYLSDDEEELAKWQIPDASIAPGEFLLIFASGLDTTDSAGYLHSSFGLSRTDNEPVILIDSDGETIIHQLTSQQVSDILEDHSGGSYPDGSNSFMSFEEATPGGPNLPQPIQAEIETPEPYSTLTSSEVVFTWSEGFQVEQYHLNIGRTSTVCSIRDSDQHLFSLSTTETGITANNIPQDGAPILACLWSHMDGEWVSSRPVGYRTSVPTAALGGSPDSDDQPQITDMISGFQMQISPPLSQQDESEQMVEESAEQSQQAQGQLELAEALSPDISLDRQTMDPNDIVRDQESQTKTSSLQNQTPSTLYQVADLVVDDLKLNPATQDYQIRWNKGLGVDRLYLDVGTEREFLASRGEGDLYSREVDLTAESTLVEGPEAGSGPVYVRLWSSIKGSWIPGPVVEADE